jgi:hypothetical protein
MGMRGMVYDSHRWIVAVTCAASSGFVLHKLSDYRTHQNRVSGASWIRLAMY